MIYVTQGHEKSIALEIFLKSFLRLSDDEQKKICFIGRKSDLQANLLFLGLEEKLLSNLKIKDTEKEEGTPTLSSLLLALKEIRPQDILITLPTSKDQLEFKGRHFLGYTEFLRDYFKNPALSMNFVADEERLLLLTDHIPLREVPATLTKDYIVQKCRLSLEGFERSFSSLEEVIFAGINPHAGEKGLLGTEDEELVKAIEELAILFPKIRFLGPYSGDTLHFHQRAKKQLMVYAFHDQGLPYFKAKHGLKGINLTLGLPFVRMSVDHGTAFELYGKNKAGFEGCEYVLKTALEMEKRRGNYGL